MHNMLLAESAEFRHLQATRMLLLILGRSVILPLAARALECYNFLHFLPANIINPHYACGLFFIE
jgi:hypothetical protein